MYMFQCNPKTELAVSMCHHMQQVPMTSEQQVNKTDTNTTSSQEAAEMLTLVSNVSSASLRVSSSSPLGLARAIRNTQLHMATPLMNIHTHIPLNFLFVLTDCSQLRSNSSKSYIT